MDTLSADKKDNHLVSVIVSVYNGDLFLKETLDSLLTQTYKNLEIIIVNDGSTDQSPSIVASYHDPRIIFINRAQNLGLTQSLNEGLARAQGKYIARLDIGDISLPSRIEEQVYFLNGHPEIGIVGAGIEIFYGQLTLRSYTHNLNHEQIKSQLLLFINPLPHSTLMIRKEVVDQLHGYDHRFTRSQDYDLLLRALNITKFGLMPEVLVRWRFDPSSLSYASSKQLVYGIAALLCTCHRLYHHKKIANEEDWEKLLAIVAEFIKKHRLDHTMVAGKYGVLARFSFLDHKYCNFLSNIVLLITHDPFFPLQGRKRIAKIVIKHLDKLLCSLS